MNDLLLKALACTPTKRPPIWIMRQAGRYMPEYRALREKYPFWELCHNSNLIAEVTQLPVNIFGMDAAILFSDILVALEPFGVSVRFEEKKGPIIHPIETKEDIKNLSQKDVREILKFVSEGIRKVKPVLQVPLIGFAGGPFTVASYLIEGGSSKDMKKTKQWMIREPESFHILLQKLTKCIIDCLHLQIDAGVDVVQIFDSWIHVLGNFQFREFALKYLEEIVRAVRKKNIPIILFGRGTSVFAPQLSEIKPSAISLDWQADMANVAKNIPSTIALQGNLDPDILYGPPEVIQRESLKIIESMKNRPGFIFNLGHGIHPDTPVDAVKLLVEQVKK